jgi:myo-inositol-1-phosphate synthase
VGECVERLVKRLEADQAKEEKAEKAERAAILKAAADEERALKVQQAAERKEAEVERKAAEAAQAATELAARRGAYLCRSPCAGAGSRGSLRALRPLRPVDSPSLGRITARRPAPAWLCCAAPGWPGVGYT